MNFFESKEALLGQMIALRSLNPGNFGFVARELPLLSNLTVLQNITLIKQYHENLRYELAQEIAMRHLKRLSIEAAANKRIPQLSEEETFFIKIIRAAMLLNSEIIVDRPFSQVTESFNAELLHMNLKTLADCYLKCQIFDYSWNMERYKPFK